MSTFTAIGSDYKSGGSATVIVAAGGTGHAWALGAAADVTVMVDSVDELAGIPHRANLIKVPVGDHETLQTLIGRMAGDELAERLSAYYQGRPNILLSKGMAQDPRIGELVIRDLARSGRLAAVATEVMKQVMVAANGALAHVELIEVNSNAGGMGAGGGPEIGDFLAAHLERSSQATVKHSMYRVGALTFLTLAPRAVGNARMVTVSNLARLTRQRSARRIQSMELIELPLRDQAGRPIGDDRELRDRLIDTLMQARRSPEVCALLDAREVNDRDGEFGEMIRMAARWSHVLDMRQTIRGAAGRYLRELMIDREQWGRSAAETDQAIEVASGELDVPGVDGLLAELKNDPRSDGPLMSRLLTADPACRAGDLTLKSSQGSTPLEALIRQFRRGAIARERMESLYGAIRRKQVASLTETKEARTRLETSRKSLRSALAASRKSANSGWSRFLGKIEPPHNTAKKAARFARLLEPRLRAVVADFERLARSRADGEVLNEALTLLGRAASSQTEALVTGLSGVAGTETLDARFVRYIPLARALPKLRDAASLGGNALEDELAGCVETVTLAGVAAMFGTTPDAASIVTAMLESDYRWVSPMWGGGSTLREPRRRVLVLPPMADDEFELLRCEAEARRFLPLLLRGACVAAAVAMDFYSVTEYADVLPAFYESQLVASVADPAPLAAVN
jgi:hypothetical protein